MQKLITLLRGVSVLVILVILVTLATNGAMASTQIEAPYVYTDDAGRYRFESMPKGTHKVTIDLSTLPSHLRPPVGEASPVLWLTPGMEQTSEAVSTGVRFTAAYDRASGDISGLVFLDLDGDGRPGPNDLGLPGVRVIDPTVHQYYIPFNDANLWTLFDHKNTGLPGAQQCHPDGIPVAGTLSSSTFLVASGDGTVYYYDHWEDGYDADPLVPGATTLRGDLDAGGVANFRSNINPALVGDITQGYYDGRDRITVYGLGVAVVRMVFPSTPGVVLASAWEISEVSDWGTEFVTAVGEDLDFNPGGVNDHDFTGLEIMAALPGTEVSYNGEVRTLNRGQTWFIDGANDGADGDGVDSIDTITASAPIQVQMLSGGCGARYSAFGYTLQPVTEWGNDYWAPVPGFSCRGNAADSDIYLHNHNGDPINVTVVSNLGTVDVPIPDHTTISLLDYVTTLPLPGWADISTGSTGIHLFSADPFEALAVVDSASNGLSQSENYDWGYSPIPVSSLSSQVVVGYAPGNNNQPPTNNGNSAFVVATTDTVIYVDLNQDGAPDAFDMNGDGDAFDNNVFGVAAWDEPGSAGGIPLLAGQTTRVGDPIDRNLEGALIYSSDYQDRISVAWGQDPCRAAIGDPYLDLGYTVLPITIPSVSKEDALAIEADDGCIGVSPGDTLTYTISLANNGLGSMSDVILTDYLPYTYTDFVVGSLQAPEPPAHDDFEFSNDGINFDAALENPGIQAFRVQWPVIGPRQVVTITFLVTLHTDIPETVTEITNQAEVDSANTDPVLSEDPDDPFDPDTDTTIRHCAEEPTPTLTSTPSEPPTPTPTLTPERPTSEPPEPEPPTPTITPTPYTTITPTPYTAITPTSVVPTTTIEVLTVERLPETGGLPGWFTIVLGVSITIGLAGLLNLTLLERRGRRGDGEGD